MGDSGNSGNSQGVVINLNKKKRDRLKTDIWEYFEEGPRNRDHCSVECKFCSWKQQVGQPIEMQKHIAINYSKVPYEIKTIFLEKVKNNGRLEHKNKINKINN